MATFSSNSLVGTSGEFFVCAELCRRQYLALLAPKNNPLFDVVAISRYGTQAVSIQVKTRSVQNKQGWKLGTNSANEAGSNGLFVVLVNLHESGLPDFHIYEHSVLSKRVQGVYTAYMATPRKDGSPKKEVGFRWFDEVSFTADDWQRKNNWQPIESALRTP